MPEDFTPRPYGLACNPCLDGNHQKCKQDVYDPHSKTRQPCNCHLRTMAEHP